MFSCSSVTLFSRQQNSGNIQGQTCLFSSRTFLFGFLVYVSGSAPPRSCEWFHSQLLETWTDPLELATSRTITGAWEPLESPGWIL